MLSSPIARIYDCSESCVGGTSATLSVSDRNALVAAGGFILCGDTFADRVMSARGRLVQCRADSAESQLIDDHVVATGRHHILQDGRPFGLAFVRAQFPLMTEHEVLWRIHPANLHSRCRENVVQARPQCRRTALPWLSGVRDAWARSEITSAVGTG